MGRIYTFPLAPTAGVSSDADWDIFQLDAAATAGQRRRVIVHELSLTTSIAAAAKIHLRWVRRSTAGSGTAVTPSPNDEGNTDPAITVCTAVIATPGTIISSTVGRTWQWDQMGELLMIPTPETRIITGESGILCLNCQTSQASPPNFSGHIVFEEG